jgi:hypothetical protein
MSPYEDLSLSFKFSSFQSDLSLVMTINKVQGPAILM